MNPRITMAEVAKAAGVHQTTVSLALRNHPSIPEATRERIHRLAQKLGYRPNPLVSALVAERRRGRPSGKGDILGFLTAYDQADGWKHSANYVAVHRELRNQAELRGYRLADFWLCAPGMTPSRLRDILLNRGVRGLLVCPMPAEPRVIDFDFSGFAAVALGFTLQAPLLDRVAIDYQAVMHLAIARLRAKGCQRIAFATTREIDDRVNHLSLGAFLSARHLEPRCFIRPHVTARWTRTAFLVWLRETRPDALITAITPDYRLLQSWLADAPAVSHPPELVCVDCAVNDPHQTGVVQNLAAEARAAIDFVTSRVERAQFGLPAEPQTILVTGTWREAAPAS